MKLERLVHELENHRGTVIYLTNNEFAFAGYVYNPRKGENSVYVDTCPYVCFSFDRGKTLTSLTEFQGLKIYEGERITKKIRTHKRHVADRSASLPEDYLSLAWELRRVFESASRGGRKTVRLVEGLRERWERYADASETLLLSQSH